MAAEASMLESSSTTKLQVSVTSSNRDIKKNTLSQATEKEVGELFLQASEEGKLNTVEKLLKNTPPPSPNT